MTEVRTTAIEVASQRPEPAPRELPAAHELREAVHLLQDQGLAHGRQLHDLSSSMLLGDNHVTRRAGSRVREPMPNYSPIISEGNATESEFAPKQQ